MKINIIKIFIATVLVLAPFQALALEMPQSGNDLASLFGINAPAYIVTNVLTGQVLISKNEQMPWTPASLTKLVTALVVLDTKPNLSKSIAITQADQIAGACGSGGACIKAKAGVKFTVDGLFHAALLPSANNAANALARSTGLSQDEFVKRMNAKAASLGATNSSFKEPTGMDPANTITAGDYAKIVSVAFSNSYLKDVDSAQSYFLKSTNNYRYNQTIKNTDGLLSDSNFQVVGAKTGYLNESKYNFASLLQLGTGTKLAVVVLGEQHLYTAFDETKQLAMLGQQAEQLLALNFGEVLGTSTQRTILQ